MSEASPGTALRRRFWITVLCFVVANAAAWVVYDRYVGARHRGRLGVEAVLPGDGQVIEGRTPIRWHFDADVVPTDLNRVAPGKITPPIAGRWEWESARVLAFTPREDFPRAMPVSFTLSGDSIQSTTGAHLQTPLVSHFRSRPLALLEARQCGAMENDRYVVELRFNDRVAPGDVLSHLTATGPQGEQIATQLQGQAAGDAVRIALGPVEAPKGAPLNVDLRISAGLPGLGGPLATDQPVNRPVVLGRELYATQASAAAPLQGAAFLQLSFNNAVESEVLKQILTIEPAAAYSLEIDGSEVKLISADFKCGQRYSIILKPAPAGADLSRYPKPGRLTAFVPDRARGFWFDEDHGYLSSAGNRSVRLHVINQPAVHVAIWRVYENNLVGWRNARGSYSWSSVDSFARPLAQRDFAAKGEKNAASELTLSLDELLPAGEAHDGVYRISVTPAVEGAGQSDGGRTGNEYARGDISNASTLVTLSDIGLTAKRTRGGVIAWATSLRTANPLMRVRIRVYSDKNQLLGESLTDANGLAELGALHAGPNESPQVILAEYAGDGEGILAATQPATSPATQESGFAELASAHIAATQASGEWPEPMATAPTGLTWLDLRGSAWSMGDLNVGGDVYLRSGYDAMIYCERGVYRPGETAHLRAIVRGPENATPSAFPLAWRIFQPDGRLWKQQTASLDADGAAFLDLALPVDLATGQWSVAIGLPGAKEQAGAGFGRQTFLIEEFIPNRLKVSFQLGRGANKQPVEGSGRFGLCEGAASIPAEVQADYLFGRPAAGLPVEFSVSGHREIFAPEHWRGWTFGDVAHVVELRAESPGNEGSDSAARQRAGDEPQQRVLDDGGHLKWAIDLAGVIDLPAPPQFSKTPANPNDASGGDKRLGAASAAALLKQISDESFRGPWRISASAGVREAGGRAVNASGQIAVDALPYYLGLRRTGKEYAAPGKPCEFAIKLIKPDQSPADVSTSVQGVLLHRSWNTNYVLRRGHYIYTSTVHLEVVAAENIAMENGNGSWAPTIPADGNYVMCVRDPGTGALSSLDVLSAGPSPWEENVDRSNPQRLKVKILGSSERLAADAGEGEDAQDGGGTSGGDETSTIPVGQAARVLIVSPFAGRLLLTVETDEVIERRVIDMPASHLIVEIPVTERCRPNAYITASVIRPIDPDSQWMAHRAFGTARLKVDSADHALRIAMQAPRQMQPEQSLDVAVRITDSSGKPVSGAAVNLAAVDEGVCQLTEFRTPDPLTFFMRDRALAVKSGDIYDSLMPEVPKPDGLRAPGGDGAVDAPKSARYRSPISARRVKPVALAWVTAHTDAEGNATGHFAVPAFQGRLRVMAVACCGERFGSSEAAVTVQSPVLVQSSWPRFCAPGDEFSVPLVVFNNTQEAGEASIEVECAGDDGREGTLLGLGTEHLAAAHFNGVTIGAGAQVQLQLPVRAGQLAGAARVRLHLRMNGNEFNEQVEIPVRPAAPMMQFAGCEGISTTRPLIVDKFPRVLGGIGEVRINITPWPSLQLPEGLDYLDRYPYGCSEQTTSTCLPLLALGDIGRRLDPVKYSPQRIAAKIDDGISRLNGMQTADGGIAMWPGQSEPWPWASIYAAHFLTEARQAGYHVNDEFYNQLMAFVRKQLENGDAARTTVEVQAYAAYVMALAGKPDRSAMNRLSELSAAGGSAGDEEGFEYSCADARQLLSCAWLMAGRRDIAQQLLPQAMPKPRKQRDDGGNLDSPIRDRALAILAVLSVDPDRADLPALVQELADCGANHQWASTQDVAFAMLAIGKYLRGSTDHPQYQMARLLDGANLLAESPASQNLSWMEPNTGRSARDFRVQLTGAADGVGFVSWLQTGVPLEMPAEAAHGMKIHRSYLHIDGSPIADNTLRSGDLVRVELLVEAAPQQHNLVIEDLLPAGLEAENSHLATSARALARHHRGNRKNTTESEASGDEPGPVTLQGLYTDVRDDRVILVGNMPARGMARCEYLARAVTPGRYVIPPVRAEAMYDIATCALSGGGGRMIVLPANSTVAGTIEGKPEVGMPESEARGLAAGAVRDPMAP